MFFSHDRVQAMPFDSSSVQRKDFDDGYTGRPIHAADRCRGAWVKRLTEHQALGTSSSTLLQRKDFHNGYAGRPIHAADDGGILRAIGRQGRHDS